MNDIKSIVLKALYMETITMNYEQKNDYIYHKFSINLTVKHKSFQIDSSKYYVAISTISLFIEITEMNWNPT